MPELPEVQTIVSELNRKLKLKVIKKIEINAPKMISIGPGTVSNIRKISPRNTRMFAKILKGKKFLSVRRRAKLLIFELSGSMSMLVHLKMTGQFIFETFDQRKKTAGFYRLINSATAPKLLLPSKFTHVIFHLSGDSTLYFNDVRQFGYLKIVKTDELSKVKELHGYGPEPLTEEFIKELFLSILNKTSPKLKIKQFLVDQSRIAGIGNIYSDEILFHAKVRPTRELQSLSQKEKDLIYKYIPIVLKKGIIAKGSSVGDFVRTDGSFGQMGKYHYVYGRGKQKCKVCGDIIQTVKISGRTGSFCPYCQK